MLPGPNLDRSAFTISTLTEIVADQAAVCGKHSALHCYILSSDLHCPDLLRHRGLRHTVSTRTYQSGNHQHRQVSWMSALSAGSPDARCFFTELSSSACFAGSDHLFSLCTFSTIEIMKQFYCLISREENDPIVRQADEELLDQT